ncbi:MAG: YncE family protein [Blastocatellia bacterium]
MKRQPFLIALCLLTVAAAMMGGRISASLARDPQDQREPERTQDSEERRGIPGLPPANKIVVANRASGTISVINPNSDRVTGTYALPTGDKMPEPMYVVHARDRVFVNDRANNRVVVFSPRTFVVETTVPTGVGSWHMWADEAGRQIWVNNETDKTSTVIDPLSLQVLATAPMPADLASAGGRPHDVILDPADGAAAYVTLIGVTGPSDFVVKFNTQSFTEVGRAAVGKDPHVSATRHNNLLYVPCQNSNTLVVLNRETLAPVTSLAIPGAHGAGMAADGATFYTTNLPGGGRAGLWTVDTRANATVGTPLDTPFNTPHNIALTPDRGIFFPNDRGSRKLYLTHSGTTNNKVTVYRLNGNLPVYHKEVTVGFNPFGLSYVP